MARKPVTIAELESATRMVHCMYGGVVRLGNIWRVLRDCGCPPAWGWEHGPVGGIGVSYSPANLEEGLRLVREQIEQRQQRNARAKARREHRRNRLFAKLD